ncbi:MAG: peptidoglycan editing factor PgeF [Comamonadaceae bacterium]|nr:peptidoglycan editing factor PgeF [Comamonadaceae bacterium]
MGGAVEHIVPVWPAPAGVRALFTTRDGGVSQPPFDSFNLGDHVRDEPTSVAANREHLRAITSPAAPVFLQQVHGTRVVQLDVNTPDGTEADGCVVRAGSGMVASIMVADCLPVLFVCASGAAVAAAHAGWRGLAGGVIETTVRALREVCTGDTATTQEKDAAIVAWLGPCIGPQAFEVGPEVVEAFVKLDAGAIQCFSAQPGGKYLADLPGLARRRLLAAGVSSVHGNDGSPQWCTATQSTRFFSHRRDAGLLGSTGRMVACVWFG